MDAEKKLKEVEAWIRGCLKDCVDTRDRLLREQTTDFIERRRINSDRMEYDLRISVYKGILINLFGDPSE